MNLKPKSIRPFIGAKYFGISRTFYRELGFEEFVVSDDMSYFESEGFGFYLQDYYVKKWINNTMVFLEVSYLERYLETIKELKLEERYKHVRLSEIAKTEWGREFFLHDPSGVLWHIGEVKL